ncbi:hypothetical protein KZO25_16530 [Halomonas sp. ANAO-440]|uniref:hypothetical protein n=1 Tax=Halomonas sp. ANAO-440 TaxID=2861360 RepID=UPI001CAA800D|nr:hypothetical protein [Halomonas sp. ANAO-440]MBZ0331925.1 hypothetical protein [Halomonas sp. ANAO-440]
MYASSILFDARSFGAQLPRHLGELKRDPRYGEGRHELLVVDDTGDRRLPGLASRFGVTLLPCPRCPLGERLNGAVAASQGELLLFPGGALHGFPAWLDNQLSDIGQQGWDAALLGVRNRSVLLRLLNWLYRASPTDTICVTRRWFERIGGFDPELEYDAIPELIERLRACQARISIGGA